MCEPNTLLMGFIAVLSILIAASVLGVYLGVAIERSRKPWRPKPDSFLAIDWRMQERRDRERRLRRGDD